jgi:DNA-binding IscR family transcriptional regulator
MIVRARRERESILGAHLFSDPAWDALLELYVARLEYRRVSLEELAVKIRTVPSVTARWIRALAENNLVVLEESDNGCWVSLSALGAIKLASLADRWETARPV